MELYQEDRERNGYLRAIISSSVICLFSARLTYFLKAHSILLLFEAELSSGRKEKSSFLVIVADRFTFHWWLHDTICRFFPSLSSSETSCPAAHPPPLDPPRIYWNPLKGNRFVPLYLLCTSSSSNNPMKMTLIRQSSWGSWRRTAEDDKFIVWSGRRSRRKDTASE